MILCKLHNSFYTEAVSAAVEAVSAAVEAVSAAVVLGVEKSTGS